MLVRMINSIAWLLLIAILPLTNDFLSVNRTLSIMVERGEDETIETLDGQAFSAAASEMLHEFEGMVNNEVCE